MTSPKSIVARLRGPQDGRQWSLFEEAASQIERLSLTDADREAIAQGIEALEEDASIICSVDPRVAAKDRQFANTLRSLLLR